MTHDTRVADWLGHSGASLRQAVLGEKFILSLSSGRGGLSLEALLCSGVSQAVVSTTYDWIFLYTSKANWTYDIILRNSRKSYKLVTYIVNYHLNTDFVHI